MCTWKNKGCEIHWEGPMSCDQISLRAGRFGLFFFWCTMVVYKVFPRKLRILFLSVNAFPLSRQINSAAKKFLICFYIKLLLMLMSLLSYLLLFLSIVVYVLCPQIPHVVACILHTKHSKKERKEREWVSEKVNKRYCIYMNVRYANKL